MTSELVRSLKPAECSIRPEISEEKACDLVKQLYGLTVTFIKELNSYDDRNFYITADKNYNNKYIDELWPHGYVLKILNPTKDSEHCVAQHEMMRLMSENGFSNPLPALNVRGEEFSLETLTTDQQNSANNSHQGSDDSLHVVRLLNYIEGQMLVTVPYTASLLHNVGQYMARTHNVLEIPDSRIEMVNDTLMLIFFGFTHPALENNQNIWVLQNVSKIRDFFPVLNDQEKLKLVTKAVQKFDDEVITKQHWFKRGTTHGDFNESNILVRECCDIRSTDKVKQYEVCGILDFGESSISCYIYEIAISIMYLMIDSSVLDPLDVGAHILAGYLKVRTLSREELECLPQCVAVRFAQSLVLGYYNYTLDQNEILLRTSKNGWSQLRQLSLISSQELISRWNTITKDNYNIALY